MAYMIEAWEKDGPNGEARLAVRVMKRVAEAAAITAEFAKLPRCVHVTKCRTDGQDTCTRAETKAGKNRGQRKVTTMWHKPGYSPI